MKEKSGKPSDPFSPEYKDYKVTKLPRMVAIEYTFLTRESHLLPKPSGCKVCPHSRAQ